MTYDRKKPAQGEIPVGSLYPIYVAGSAISMIQCMKCFLEMEAYQTMLFQCNII